MLQQVLTLTLEGWGCSASQSTGACEATTEDSDEGNSDTLSSKDDRQADKIN